MLHVTTGQAASFDLEIDFMGNGTWHRYERLEVPAEGYARHIFPDAFSAHWVRLRPHANVKVTASFFFA
jgi:hypothetical protein